MDEVDLVKTGMEVMLRPVTEITENALGLMGGDWLSEKRTQNRAKLKLKTEKILKDRGAKLDADTSPSIIAPLLSAAQDEGREELLDVWAKLLASAMDPKRRGGYRREFVDIVKQFEPLDVLVLLEFEKPGMQPSTAVNQISERLGLERDQVVLAVLNLGRLGCAESQPNLSLQNNAMISARGRQLLQMLRN
jgi:hypothetical protein